jgi:hypothetical protein
MKKIINPQIKSLTFLSMLAIALFSIIVSSCNKEATSANETIKQTESNSALKFRLNKAPLSELTKGFYTNEEALLKNQLEVMEKLASLRGNKELMKFIGVEAKKSERHVVTLK